MAGLLNLLIDPYPFLFLSLLAGSVGNKFLQVSPDDKFFYFVFQVVAFLGVVPIVAMVPTMQILVLPNVRMSLDR